MEPITILGLCEQNAVILFPNRLYKFVVVKDCAKCKAILESLE